MKREKSMLRIESSAQFIDFISNTNAEQYVIYNDGKCKTLCTIESANKEIEKLINENKMLREAWDDMFHKWETQVYRIAKAIEHIEKHQLCYQSQYEELSGFDNHLLDILKGKK